MTINNADSFPDRKNSKGYWQFSLGTFLSLSIYCGLLLGVYWWAAHRVAQAEAETEQALRQLRAEKAMSDTEKKILALNAQGELAAERAIRKQLQHSLMSVEVADHAEWHRIRQECTYPSHFK